MKTFEIVIRLYADDSVEEDDIDLLPDDVIDGFTLSRTNRLGDITSEFVLKSAYIEEKHETPPVMGDFDENGDTI